MAAILEMLIQINLDAGTHLPDFRTKEPNLRASTVIDCAISSVLYAF